MNGYHQETYRRATMRRVDRVQHLYWKRNGKPLCGDKPHEYDPAPAKFLKGDVKPDVFSLDCPICAAIAVMVDVNAKLSREQDA